MEPTKEQLDVLFRERVLRARRMPPEEKLLAGPRLFDLECRIMADGIREEFPDADEERVQAILAHRLALLRRLEEAGLYVNGSPSSTPPDLTGPP